MTFLHTPCWQEVGPDVDGLVVHLEAAEDTVQRWAPRVTVSRDDAVLPEHLRTNHTVQVNNDSVQSYVDPCGEKFSPHLLPKKDQELTKSMQNHTIIIYHLSPLWTKETNSISSFLQSNYSPANTGTCEANIKINICALNP